MMAKIGTQHIPGQRRHMLLGHPADQESGFRVCISSWPTSALAQIPINDCNDKITDAVDMGLYLIGMSHSRLQTSKAWRAGKP